MSQKSASAKEALNQRKNTSTIGTQKADDAGSKQNFPTSSDKVFIVRNSLLTDLFNKSIEVRTVYNLWIASSIVLLVHIIAEDYVNHGIFDVGITIFKNGFAPFHWTIFTWLMLFGCVQLVYPAFHWWSQGVLQLQKEQRTLWNGCWLIAAIIYYLALFTLTAILSGHFELGVGSGLAITIEHARLMMKLHAFLRTNAEKALNYRAHSEGSNWNSPTFRQFWYFLWAPTLIYRDSYARSREIRWKFIRQCLVEIAGVIGYITLVGEYFIRRSIQDFGERIYTVGDLMLVFVRNTISGFLIIFTSHYVISHATQNLFAELLRFGDRQFCLEWWQSDSIQQYHRRYTLLVQEWLHVYVYRDVRAVCRQRCIQLSARRARLLAVITVFLVSSIMHEWMLVTIFRFFYPVMLVECLVFTFILSLTRIRGNVAFWLMISFGNGTLLSLYGLEFLVRYKHQIGVVNATGLLPSFTPIMFNKQFMMIL